MTPQILAWLATVKARFIPTQWTILEVGAFNVNGSPRSVFVDAIKYVGVDQDQGPDVDLVADAHTLSLGEKFDTVICCETLEHDTDPLLTVRRLREHLTPGGLLIITTPSNGFGEHFYPRDYWRFMRNAYEDLFFVGMETLELVEIEGPTLCGVARSQS
jgi:SAM-dependent methyltransferase